MAVISNVQQEEAGQLEWKEYNQAQESE